MSSQYKKRPGADDDDEDMDEISPYEGVQKNAVMHEARCFNEVPLNTRQSYIVLAKMLYLLTKGETFTNQETTQLFFSITKLFQSQDLSLRRMLYLAIKSLNTKQDEVLIVTSSLCQDVNSKNDMFRSNAIRVLAKVIDTSMLTQVERFFKQAIVDKSSFTASSALVAGVHLFTVGPEVVRRWVNEVQDAINNKSPMVQYHALHLLYLIRRHDRLAISKVVSTLVRNPPRSPFALCLLIRYIGASVDDVNSDRTSIEFLTSMLRGRGHMVLYEAARELIKIRGIPSATLAMVVVALQELLTHASSATRYAAVKILYEIVQMYPSLLLTSVQDLEHLMQDSNKSIATLAATTLLRTGLDAAVDRTMRTLPSFMNEIPDEHKLTLIDAISALTAKFPAKYPVMLKFLSACLREEGGFEYKKKIVSAIMTIMDMNDECKDTGLDHLCEFIEDCEFNELAVQILHILADEANRTKNSARFIRHIFNRTILESETIRAASVAALAKIGTNVESLSDSVVVLLSRCQNDSDDEVRDRAVFFMQMLTQHRPTCKQFLTSTTQHSLATLSHSVETYLAQNDFSHPFDQSRIVLARDEAIAQAQAAVAAVSPAATSAASAAPAHASSSASEAVEAVNPYLAVLNSVPEFSALGPLLKSSKSVDLTESEAEYLVSYVKHIFPSHVVFQFNITNTLEDIYIDKSYVDIEIATPGWTVEHVVPSSCLGGNAKQGLAFTCLRRADDAFSMDSVPSILKFIQKDDPEGSGFDDEYQLNEVEVLETDFMMKGDRLNLIDFRRHWESLNEQPESVKTFNLSMNSLEEAVKAVVELVGLEPVENSHIVNSGAPSHALNMAGTFLSIAPVYARAAFLLDAKTNSVRLKLAARSPDSQFANMVTSSIR